jgi:Family of unknown function (DUF6335)
MKKRAAKSERRPAKSRKRSARPNKGTAKSQTRPAKARARPELAKKRSPAATKRSTNSRPRPASRRKSATGIGEAGQVTQLPEALVRHHETSPALSGGDLDADWMGAETSGEEAVGGSVATPDQDTVDEIGRALGIEQRPDEQVRTSDEILRERARHRWDIEGDAADEAERKER